MMRMMNVGSRVHYADRDFRNLYLNNPLSRVFRPKFKILSWHGRPTNAQERLRAILSQAQIDANTTRGTTPGLVDPGNPNGPRIPLPVANQNEGQRLGKRRLEGRQSTSPENSGSSTSKPNDQSPTEELSSTQPPPIFPGQIRRQVQIPRLPTHQEGAPRGIHPSAMGLYEQWRQSQRLASTARIETTSDRKPSMNRPRGASELSSGLPPSSAQQPINIGQTTERVSSEFGQDHTRLSSPQGPVFSGPYGWNDTQLVLWPRDSYRPAPRIELGYL